MPELSLLSAFLVGLLGGAHCVGMCGGIVGALSFQPGGGAAPWRFYVGYNLGRVASYTVAGALAGAAGAGSAHLAGALPVQQVLYLLANLLLVALGLYLAGLWHGVVYIERAGGWLWRGLQPLTRRFLPVRSVWQACALGALWGWLPCGLVYSVLVTALASGGPAGGAALMLAFALGTLPNLLAIGFFAQQLKHFTRQRAVRLAAGVVVVGFGVLGLARLGSAWWGGTG